MRRNATMRWWLVLLTVCVASCAERRGNQNTASGSGTPKTTDSATSASTGGDPVAQDSAVNNAPPPPPPPPTSSDAQSGGAIGAPPHTPPQGSAERKAIIDAVRASVGNTTQYRVSWLRATPRWAFFQGTEVVPLERGEEQETDLTVEALLERRIGADVAWQVVEKWMLPGEDSAPRSAFLSAIRSRMRRDALPKTLFPTDLFQ